jgi:hypothetical protein
MKNLSACIGKVKKSSYSIDFTWGGHYALVLEVT